MYPVRTNKGHDMEWNFPMQVTSPWSQLCSAFVQVILQITKCVRTQVKVFHQIFPIKNNCEHGETLKQLVGCPANVLYSPLWIKGIVSCKKTQLFCAKNQLSCCICTSAIEILYTHISIIQLNTSVACEYHLVL